MYKYFHLFTINCFLSDRVGCAWPRHSLFLNTLLPTPVIRSQLTTSSWRGVKDSPQFYTGNCKSVLWSHKRHLWWFNNNNNKKSHHWHVKCKIPRANVIIWFRHLLQISSVRATWWNKFHPNLYQFSVLTDKKNQATLFNLFPPPSFFFFLKLETAACLSPPCSFCIFRKVCRSSFI